MREQGELVVGEQQDERQHSGLQRQQEEGSLPRSQVFLFSQQLTSFAESVESNNHYYRISEYFLCNEGRSNEKMSKTQF